MWQSVRHFHVNCRFKHKLLRFHNNIIVQRAYPVTLLQFPCFGNNKRQGSRSPRLIPICFVINVLIRISNYLVTGRLFRSNKRHGLHCLLSRNRWNPNNRTRILRGPTLSYYLKEIYRIDFRLRFEHISAYVLCVMGIERTIQVVLVIHVSV